MNRWKCATAWLLIAVMIMTNSMVSYADTEEQNNGESGTTVSGEASGNASSDASGDTSGEGEGQKEYVTISFFSKDILVKTVQIERGATVELWEANHTDYYIFKGWYYLVSETLGCFVNEYTTFDKDTSLYACFEHDPNWKGPTAWYPSSEEELKQAEIRRQTKRTQTYTYHAQIEFKNIIIKKKNKLSLKIRSDRMPSSPIEIQYSTSKKFTKGKTKIKIVKRAENKSEKKFKKVIIKKLKKNKTYYIRARVKTEYNGETFYSKWSKVQKVKMKN